MKTPSQHRHLIVFLIVAYSLSLQAQYSSITYQGRLEEGGQPANGIYDFEFTLYDAPTNGNAVGGVFLPKPGVPVTNGLFQVELDFPLTLFTGADRWLEIDVRTNGYGGPVFPLSPRQKIGETPHAIYSRAAATAGTATNAVTASGVAVGAVGTAGLVDGAVTSAKIADGTITAADVAASTFNTTFWGATGNAGTTPSLHFLGTTDNQPLEIRVNGQRALRVEAVPGAAPNWIAGSASNRMEGAEGARVIAGGQENVIGAASAFATVGGGTWNNIGTNAFSSTIAGGYGNAIAAGSYNSAVGGGYTNVIESNSPAATIGGGVANRISTTAGGATLSGGYLNHITHGAYSSTISGGESNTNAALRSTLGGGWLNQIEADSFEAVLAGGSINFIGSNSAFAMIGGGRENRISTNASYATIPGGYLNEVNAPSGFAAGRKAKANHAGAFVWADSTDADFASTTTNEFTVRAGGGLRLQSDRGVLLNAANAPLITRGWDPFDASAGPSKSGLGRWGLFQEPYSLVLGIPGDDVPGRTFQVGKYSASGSYSSLLTVDQTGKLSANQLEINQGLNLSGTATVGGALSVGSGASFGGLLTAGSASINTTLNVNSTATVGSDVMAGRDVTAGRNLIAGGIAGVGTANPQAQLHIYSGASPTVARIHSSGNPGLGRLEFVSNPQGDANEWRPGYIQSLDAGNFTGGLAFYVNGTGSGSKFGSNEVVRLVNGAVGINTISPQSTLHVNGTTRIQGPGNWDLNNTEGDFRVGNDTYRFKIGLSYGGGGAGDVWMRAQGGTARLFIKAPGGTTFYSNEAQTNGVTLAAGGGSWTSLSDRNAKENFEPVDTLAVLEKVAALPLSEWNYKSQDSEIRHLGPMAQDFRAAFGLGESDIGITTVDADGVALAAIQGLNQKLERENAELKARLDKLEQLLNELNGGAK